jgi:hypothetical protein
MSLFGNYFTKEGPGVPKNAPQKKGVARYFEVLSRDYFSLWKAGMLTALCSVPLVLSIVMLAMFSQYLGVLLIGLVAFVASMALFGPALMALHSLVILALRDEPFFFWHEYKKAWKANRRQAFAAAVLYGLLAGIECAAGWMALTQSEQSGNVMLLAAVLLGLLLVTTCWIFTIMHMLYMEMPLATMVKNSLLLTFGFAKRTIPGGVLTLVLMGAMVLYFPFITITVVCVGAPAMIALLADQWLWPVMEQAFHISDQLAERRAREQSQETA